MIDPHSLPPLGRRALLSLLVLCAAGAAAATPACPLPAEVSQEHLLGLWRAEFEGLPQGATLLLEKHADVAVMVSGTVNRDGQRARLAGDIEDGEFILEESVNGINISATWMGDVVEGSCGREIRGTWQSERDRRPHSFVLRKQ